MRSRLAPGALTDFMADEVNCRLLALWIADAKHESSIVCDRAKELMALVAAGTSPSDALAERRRRRSQSIPSHYEP